MSKYMLRVSVEFSHMVLGVFSTVTWDKSYYENDIDTLICDTYKLLKEHNITMYFSVYELNDCHINKLKELSCVYITSEFAGDGSIVHNIVECFRTENASNSNVTELPITKYNYKKLIDKYVDILNTYIKNDATEENG